MSKQPEKRIVRFLDSIAGLADPNHVILERKYSRIRAKLIEQGASPETIEFTIEQEKVRDRYTDVARGFPKDFSFKPGQEAMIPAHIALLWADEGICMLLEKFTDTTPAVLVDQIRY